MKPTKMKSNKFKHLCHLQEIFEIQQKQKLKEVPFLRPVILYPIFAKM